MTETEKALWNRFVEANKKPWVYLVEDLELYLGLHDTCSAKGWFPITWTSYSDDDDWMPVLYRCNAVYIGENPPESELKAVMDFVDYLNKSMTAKLRIRVYNWPDIPTAEEYYDSY